MTAFFVSLPFPLRFGGGVYATKTSKELAVAVLCLFVKFYRDNCSGASAPPQEGEQVEGP